jgi:sugar lactone lactonase YvrE
MPTTTSVDEPLQIFPVPGQGTEDVLVSDDGLVYTGTEDGVIHEVDPANGEVRAVGTTPGRPLGLEWLADGRILVCDADCGLFALDRKSGERETLTEEVGGRPMLFCNNAAVSGDGVVYFSDTSKHHPIARWRAEMVEDTHTGRLLRRDPDGSVTVLVEGLRFANGVALSQDESYVAVAECGGRTVVRRWLSGTKRGRTELFLDDLPGYPDNISLGTDGLIWVSICSPKDPVLEGLQRRAPLAVRKLVWRLPEAVTPKVKRMMAFDDDGKLVHDRQLSPERFHMVTGVREHHGTVWLGSLAEPAVACFEL